MSFLVKKMSAGSLCCVDRLGDVYRKWMMIPLKMQQDVVAPHSAFVTIMSNSETFDHKG